MAVLPSLKAARAQRVGGRRAGWRTDGNKYHDLKTKLQDKNSENGHKQITLCHYTFRLENGPTRVKPRKNRGARDGSRRADGRIR